MKLFVSYTLRDGVLNQESLQKIGSALDGYGETYIDVLHNRSSDRQARVIQELNAASALVACITDGFFRSEWVQLELQIAAMRTIPIIVLDLRSQDSSRRHVGNLGSYCMRH
jgi:hypothetical protein